MTDRQTFPPGVLDTIGHAIAFNMVVFHDRYGADNLEGSDLYVDVVTALHSVAEEDQEAAVRVAASALANATGWDNGPTLDTASRCLIHSLTQGNRWTRDRAERFVTAALLAVH